MPTTLNWPGQFARPTANPSLYHCLSLDLGKRVPCLGPLLVGATSIKTFLGWWVGWFCKKACSRARRAGQSSQATGYGSGGGKETKGGPAWEIRENAGALHQVACFRSPRPASSDDHTCPSALLGLCHLGSLQAAEGTLCTRLPGQLAQVSPWPGSGWVQSPQEPWLLALLLSCRMLVLSLIHI